MKKLLITLLLTSCCCFMAPRSGYGQTQLNWLLELPAFKPVLATHLKEVEENETGGRRDIVSAILFQTEPGKVVVYLTSYALLEEVEAHLPAAYTTIENQTFLVYDGSEQLIHDKAAWYNKLKTTVANKLCDDSEARALAKRPGPHMIRFKCDFLYDPLIRKLTFEKGELVKTELVGRVPFYETLPVD